MAQGNKSRVVIWTIVGILVVVAVVFLITGRKGDVTAGQRNISQEDVPGFVMRMTTGLDKFETRVAKRRADGGTPEEFAKIDELVVKMRAGLVELPTLTENSAIKASMDAMVQDFAEAKKTLKMARK